MVGVAVVVPTIRPEKHAEFVKAWKELFYSHNALSFTVWDGEKPIVQKEEYSNARYSITSKQRTLSIDNIMEDYADLIYNFNDGVRNLGFALIAKRFPEIDVIITLDDDVLPIGDPIQDHLDALDKRVPVSWMSTASRYMRGFPYGVRDEAEVVLSHGIWRGVADYDAPTQLVCGNLHSDFYCGIIPKGIYYSQCGMNLAFKRKMLPWMYFAPMGEKVGMDRFADIWCGIVAKRAIDENGWAAVSGYAEVNHLRASNVFTNLRKESRGIGLNETFWQGDESDPYFALYREKLARWQEFIGGE